MASQTDICNVACTILGATPINAITDASNQAITLKAIYNLILAQELRAHVWKFSITRTMLPALSSVPGDTGAAGAAGGTYTQQFQLPANCLRVLAVNDAQYPGADLSDYRSGPGTLDWSIEGGMVLSNLAAPLSLRYVQLISDASAFDACFAAAFAAKLAWKACFRITNSLSGQKLAMAEYKDAIKEGVAANALESVPTYPADDTWIQARFG